MEFTLGNNTLFWATCIYVHSRDMANYLMGKFLSTCFCTRIIFDLQYLYNVRYTSDLYGSNCVKLNRNDSIVDMALYIIYLMILIISYTILLV